MNLPASSPTRPEIEQFVRATASTSGLDPDLAVKQCDAESSFNPAAVSPCGAIGLFQFEPPTAKELGIDPRDWKQNVIGWGEYMGKLKRIFNGNYDQMLAAYDWGMGNVRRALIERGANWKVLLPTETANYLVKILGEQKTT